MTLRPIILVAGGSWGHLFPAIAVAQECAAHTHPVILFTDPRGHRFTLGYQSLFKEIHILPKRHWFFGLTHSPFHLFKLLKTIRPQAMLGFGGQFTVIPMLTGRALGIKCGIHQSDAIIGKAHAFLAPWMTRAFLAHPPQTKDFLRNSVAHPESVQKAALGTVRAVHPIQGVLAPALNRLRRGLKRKQEVIGMPIRKEFHSITPLDSIDLPLRIIVLGGSQGAHIWSVLMPQTLAKLSLDHQKQIEITHQCPAQDQDPLEKAYQDLGIAFQIVPFIHDMPEVLSKTHVVFSRAGASTLAELATVGRPALVIPYPHAAQDHQRENAKLLVDSGGGWAYDQERITPDVLAKFIEHCLHNLDQLLYAGKKLQTDLHRNAASLLYTFGIEP